MRKNALLSALLLGAFVSPALASNLTRDVEAWRSSHEAEIVSNLDALVRLPSVAADPRGLVAAADRLEEELGERGFATSQFVSNGSPPVVFGDYRVRGAKHTVVFYAHYDGQPVTPSEWSSGPFSPVMRDGPPGPAAKFVDWRAVKPPFNPNWRMFGRAAADDKASIVAFLAAFDALHALHRAPTVNLRVIWEGEEEAGSPRLSRILEEHAAQIQCDLLLIGDGPVHQSETPTVYFGARGAMDLELTIYGPDHPLHDGHYGNWAPNPAVMAAELIASMRDSDGRILIPGFTRDVRPLGPAEKTAVADLPPVEGLLKREYGLGRTEGDQGLTASTMRPALNIRGIASGAVGASARNAIPADAQVSIDFRLVPDQTLDDVRNELEAFLRASGWTVVKAAPDLQMRLSHPMIVKLAWGDGYPGLRTDMTLPEAQAVIAATKDAAGGRVALLPMTGGSVPIYLFHEVLKVPVIGIPIVNHDDSQHAPNENLRLGNLWKGIDTYAALMTELAW